MKILICLSSQLKVPLADYFFDSLIKYVIAKLPARPDIIGHFPPPETEKVDKLRSVADRCQFFWEKDPVLTEEQLSWNKYMAPQINGIRGNLLQWLSMKNCGRIKRVEEKIRGTYDLVIHTRPDLLFINEIENNPPALPDTLFVSPHDGWGGYNDRFCYGASGIMDSRMDIYDYFANDWYPGILRDPGSIRRGKRADWNPELVYSDYIRNYLKAAVRKTRILFLRLKEHRGAIYVMLPLPDGIASKTYDRSVFDKNCCDQILAVLFEALGHTSATTLPPYERKRFLPIEKFQPFQDKISALSEM